MAEVKWTARRVSDGVLVDVTGDTEGVPAVAPTPNALEGGGGAAEPGTLEEVLAAGNETGAYDIEVANLQGFRWPPNGVTLNDVEVRSTQDNAAGVEVSIGGDVTHRIDDEGIESVVGGRIKIGDVELRGDGLILDADHSVVLDIGTITMNGPLGYISLFDDGSLEYSGPGGFFGISAAGVLTWQGNIIGTQAAFVANGSTVDQLRDALIASGLMAAA